MTSPVLAWYNEIREQGTLPFEGGASQAKAGHQAIS